jgi:hypothetical protein
MRNSNCEIESQFALRTLTVQFAFRISHFALPTQSSYASPGLPEGWNTPSNRVHSTDILQAVTHTRGR